MSSRAAMAWLSLQPPRSVPVLFTTHLPHRRVIPSASLRDATNTFTSFYSISPLPPNPEYAKMAMSPNLRTFRLRGCPATADGPAIQVALSSAFGDIAADDIRIWSLASTVDPWEATPTKTATLTFDALPSAIEASLPKGEWPIVDRDTGHNFILDTHFLGLTPLNDLKPEDHMFE